MRIVSLLPVATEIVDALGLTENLVAVTHACTHPELVRFKPRITRSRHESFPVVDAGPALGWQVGSKSLVALDFEALYEARPNLILTQPIEEPSTIPYGEVVEAVAQMPRPYPKLVDIHTTCVEDVFQSIRAVASATGTVDQADVVCDSLWSRLETVRKGIATCARTGSRTVVIEWINPLFADGHQSYELIRLAGGIPCPTDVQGQTALSWHQIREFAPEVIVVAPCNCSMEQARRDMPALEALPGYWSMPAVRRGCVYLADGREYFNGFGPRIVQTLELLAYVVHPVLFADLAPNSAKAMRWF